MCREKENGGRRCSGRPTNEQRRAEYRIKTAKKRYKGPKDTPCTGFGCSGKGWVRVVDEHNKVTPETCGICKGSGYLQGDLRAQAQQERQRNGL